jgi:hypothetical protein
VQRHFAAAAGTGFRPDDYRVEDLVVHDTADPEVVVAEFAYAGSAGGRTFRVCGRPACDPARRVRLA